jgi:hypothetical protein
VNRSTTRKVDASALRYAEVCLKFVVSTTSVAPSQWPRESPRCWRIFAPMCGRPSSGTRRCSCSSSYRIATRPGGGEHGRCRRDRRHQYADQPIGVGTQRRTRGVGRRLRPERLLERPAQRGLEAFLVGSEIGNRQDDKERADERRPQHQAADRIPFKGGRAIGRDRAREQRKIAEPPRRQGDADEERDEEMDPQDGAEACSCGETGHQARPMAPAERGDQERQRRQIEEERRQDRSGSDRCKQQRRRRACSNSNENDLHHRKLSRFVSG